MAVLLAICTYGTGSAQGVVEDWSRTFDGAAGTFDEIRFVRLDPQHNVVVTGRSNSGTNSTYLDVVTRKYAPDGTLLWSHTWNNDFRNFNDEPKDMEIGADGTIVIAGKSSTSSSSQDMNDIGFVFSLDSDGSLLWSDSIKGSGYTSGGGFYTNRNMVNELSIHQDGSVYLAGMATGNGVTQYEQMFVARYGSDGQQQWLNFYDSSTEWEFTDQGLGLDIDGAGNAYVCGISTIANTWRDPAFWKIGPTGVQVAFGIEPGPENNVSEQYEEVLTDQLGNSYVLGKNSSFDYILFKYDADGNEVWGHVLDTIIVGTSSSFTGADAHLTFDAAGNIIFAAGMVPPSGGYSDVGLIKFTPDGVALWVSFAGGSGIYDNHSYMVVTDSDNNIYVTGSVSNEGSSSFDIGTFKFDPDGNLLWYVSHNGPSSANDKGHSMAVAADGSVYVGGYASGYTANADYFLIRYVPDDVTDVTEREVSKSGPMIFPNPTSGEITLLFNSDRTIYGAEVFDLHGRPVFRKDLGKIELRRIALDLGGLDQGAYMLRLTGPDCSHQQILIID